ncbi:hypothetical protein E1264_03130 [Actinomadura sp. KC216]|uniref:hypothetical protein n=1 Tax=Actinomadura sp. KC216 TaxID=2530370 RepID=UPI0010484DA3|nr:hypothetical protein [Actinomadura sp. KC216]TDB91006.1 hypothetical protein E1264_03130 [Actinomadura sp. KC216]
MESGVPARTEDDFLDQLASALGDLDIRTRLTRQDIHTSLVVISPTDSVLNEKVTCRVDDGSPTFAYSWGDNIEGETIAEVARAVAHVVTAESSGHGVANG